MKFSKFPRGQCKNQLYFYTLTMNDWKLKQRNNAVSNEGG